ncbi:MAG TPA: hypothetical protein PK095_09135 [Myxococcota bacterium]|nr:hypothetical protein [Myxococcota bacterium]
MRDGLRWVTTLVAKVSRAQRPDLEGLTSDVLANLYEKKLAPEDLHCPAGWLASIIANEVRTLGREKAAKKRGGDAVHVSPDDSAPFDLPQPDSTDPVQRIEQRRQWTRLAHIALDGPIPGRPRLGFLAFFLARHIARRHIEEAKTQVDRSKEGVDGGLLRSADETWGMLCDGLMRRHPEGVDGDDEGHLELAFVLRSTHPGPAAEWGRSDRQVVAKARDLVRKWAARGRDQVKALALADGGGR